MGYASDKIGLGHLVKDSVTGFEGIVTAVTRYLGSTDRICVQPRIVKDGKVAGYETFERRRLQLLQERPESSPGAADIHRNVGRSGKDVLLG